MLATRGAQDDKKLVAGRAQGLSAVRVRENCFFMVTLTFHLSYPSLASRLAGVNSGVEQNREKAAERCQRRGAGRPPAAGPGSGVAFGAWADAGGG